MNDAILLLLLARQLYLLDTLRKRGHAAQDSIHIADIAARRERLPKALKQARSEPLWSSLGGTLQLQDRQRSKCIEQLMLEIQE